MKFNNLKLTADGKARAFIEAQDLKTLWFNTGTLCNLTCKNCYIESSPTNDRLSYLSFDEYLTMMNEAKQERFSLSEIGFTGGEPFLNKDFPKMLTHAVKQDLDVLVLTNAMKPMLNKKAEILTIDRDRLTFRISIDHVDQIKHEQIRGANSYEPMMEGLRWLRDNGFKMSLATRLMWGESEEDTRKVFAKFISTNQLPIDAYSMKDLVTFTEMDVKKDTPEITTECWSILNKNPKTVMCSSSRMVVKKKGNKKPSVIACTLLPYDEAFDLGSSLKSSMQRIYLNHPHCSKFCVLGGSSCS
jgi:molybdenum cofactor biosynthesis enzyme MoaA